MAKVITAKALTTKHVKAKDRVLLVNPPVEETRYSWLRWNQPLDLLKIASFLRAEIGCQVQLFDYMQPDSKGKVLYQRLPGARQNKYVGGERYPMRRYGQPYRALRQALTDKRLQQPTQVWITSLCSYWFSAVAQVCGEIRQTLPKAKIVLVGNYAQLTPQQAAETCPATYVVSKPIDLSAYPAALDLYETPPPFAALSLSDAKVAAREATEAVKSGVNDFAIFSDNVLSDGGVALKALLKATRNLHKHLRIHLLCGLYPDGVTAATAKILSHKSIAALHFEESTTKGELNTAAYEQAIAHLADNNVEIPSKSVSGFAWIGRPQEDLQAVITRVCKVVQLLGNVILKPFTPTPEGPEAKQHADYLSGLAPQDWSPHLFPFAELNGIDQTDYSDLYRLAAFLNEKVRSRSFDFLADTLGAEFFKESLRREVWRLEPTRTFKAPKRRALRTVS